MSKHEEMPDVEHLFKLVTRVLRAKKDAMVRADGAHQAELGDDDEAGKSRDDASQKLYDKLVELRDVITGVYGAETAGKVFSGATPIDPVVLGRFAAAALERIKLPAPRIKGAKFDVAETVEGIRAAAATLDDYVQDVAREVREAQATLDAKIASGRALVAFGRLGIASGRALVAFRSLGSASGRARVTPEAAE